jgi:tRNA(Ile)-lysidine synthase
MCRRWSWLHPIAPNMPVPSMPLALPAKLDAAWPAERWRDVTVLVAVSGGADSVALLRALCGSGQAGEGRLIVAHFNHCLRGAESEADEAFVAELAQQLGLQLVAGKAAGDLAAGGSGEGVEGAARQARYEFLASAAGQVGARYVATAHTADDQVETVLFNILRGTGLAGLAGIPRIRKLREATTIVRPLLDVTRGEVLDYLQSLGQPYRDDSSNRQENYTRNRIRLQLLPMLEREFNPRVREALLRLARIGSEADQRLDAEVRERAKQAVRAIPGGVDIQADALRDGLFGRYLLMHVWREMGWPLQDMSFEKWEQLCGLAEPSLASQAQPAQIFPGGVRAERSAAVLRLTRP